jgi:hypothetical protein
MCVLYTHLAGVGVLTGAAVTWAAAGEVIARWPTPARPTLTGTTVVLVRVLNTNIAPVLGLTGASIVRVADWIALDLVSWLRAVHPCPALVTLTAAVVQLRCIYHAVKAVVFRRTNTVVASRVALYRSGLATVWAGVVWNALADAML